MGLKATETAPRHPTVQETFETLADIAVMLGIDEQDFINAAAAAHRQAEAAARMEKAN